MGLNCQHCGTRYTEFARHNGFCCSGCEQVYALIQAEGMESYYALQDRVGKPPNTGSGGRNELLWVKELQAIAEKENQEPSATVSLYGMTCVGCVWLVEKVSSGHSGVKSARVDLELNTVVIDWIRDSFSLHDLMVELSGFGYNAAAYDGGSVSKVSPLLWRLCLCALFAANGFLLAVFSSFVGVTSDYRAIIQLLQWFVAGLGAFVGATFFVIPAYQSLRRFRLHYDALPAFGLLIGYVSAVLGNGELWHVSLLLTALLGIRWVHRWQWERVSLPPLNVDSRVLWVLQSAVVAILVAGVSSWFIHDASTAIVVLIVSSLYPLARCVSHLPSFGFVLINLVCAFAGVILGYLGGTILLAVVYLVSTGVICNFLFFRYPNFCSRQ